MLIFLEGPEAAGKTNLANKLSKQWNMDIIKFSWPRTEEEKKQMFEMYTEFIYKNPNGIVDRCWYSDMIYAPLVRNEHSAISKGQMYELERLVISQGGGMVIHATAPVGKLWKRFNDRGDDYIKQDFELISRIKKDYEFLFHKVPHFLPVFKYEYNENLSSL